MEFNTREKCNDFVSCAGNQYENLFDSKIQKDGSVRLVISGKKDIQQEIDSWIDQTDMSYILNAMQAGVYQPRSGAQYGDFTNMPSDIREVMQLQIDAEKAFYDLSKDIRNKFDNDYRKWLVCMNEDTQKFSELMGFVDAAMQDPAGSVDTSGKEEGEN